ncbi:MAG TPA: hypothetical protein PLA50_00385 [Bacteroidia bacterium]|nr:hypothetical protein [Bacteroidia bacterium]
MHELAFILWFLLAGLAAFGAGMFWSTRRRDRSDELIDVAVNDAMRKLDERVGRIESLIKLTGE